MRTPIAISAITPAAAPTPIPAFAPVDRPALSLFCGVEVGEGVGVFVAFAFAFAFEEVDGLDGLGDIEALVDVGSSELVITPLKVGATLNFSRLGSEQQSVVLPQHQNSDVGVPSQGVTVTSFLLCSSYKSLSAFNRAPCTGLSYSTRT
jgi:hypothetical protein